MGRIVKPAIAVIAIAIAGPADAHCYSIWNYKTPQHCGGLYARRTPPVAVTPPIKEAALKATDDPPQVDPPAREVVLTPEGAELWPDLKPWDEELAAERALALNRLRQELAAPR
jgi:hypothetical protein